MLDEISALIEKYAICPKESPFYETCNPLLIYGAGNIGKDVCRILNSRGIKILAFLDRKANAGDQWNGIPIYAPDWDGLSHAQKQQAGIIIALHNRDVNIPPIITALRREGYVRVITLIEFFDRFGGEMGERYWLTSRIAYQAWVADILKGYKVWADERSRQIYLNLLRYRLTGNYDDLVMPDTDQPYFPSRLLQWESPLRFVDGGAFDGDTLRELFKTKYDIECIATFEPDLENFRKLAEYVFSSGNKRVYLWPCGIYSTTQQLYFQSGRGEGSRILSGKGETSKISAISNTTMIQAIALDDVIPSFEPNLIKFDIEGAEYDGLMGAKRIIRENKPGLAICTYHRPEHLWSIPLLIDNEDLGYKFYLRVYKHNEFESVLYAKVV